MRILVAPVLVGDRICRIVSPIDSLLEVEEWVGEWWEPSSVTLTTASRSPAAPVSVLCARGVPSEDCVAEGPAPGPTELQDLLRVRQPEHHGLSPSESAPSATAHGLRRKQYTGNARFRRARPDPETSALDRADLRRAPTTTAWNGPWRRAADHATDGEADTAS